MKKVSTLSIAALFALGSFGQIAPAVETEHSGHTGSGGESQQMGGMHAGGMHEMMMEHMQEMHGPRHKGYAEVVLQHMDDLKLSDEQIGKITRIHQSNQKAVEELGKKVRESMKSAHELFLSPSSDEATIRKAAKEHTAAFDELVETALKSRNAINALLTPEQLQKLKSLKAEH